MRAFCSTFAQSLVFVLHYGQIKARVIFGCSFIHSLTDSGAYGRWQSCLKEVTAELNHAKQCDLAKQQLMAPAAPVRGSYGDMVSSC